LTWRGPQEPTVLTSLFLPEKKFLRVKAVSMRCLEDISLDLSAEDISQMMIIDGEHK
jgi:hypothetical protein